MVKSLRQKYVFNNATLSAQPDPRDCGVSALKTASTPAGPRARGKLKSTQWQHSLVTLVGLRALLPSASCGPPPPPLQLQCVTELCLLFSLSCPRPERQYHSMCFFAKATCRCLLCLSAQPGDRGEEAASHSALLGSQSGSFCTQRRRAEKMHLLGPSGSSLASAR